jgi:hypothetical protein
MKIIREHINEKFTEDSDPIADMNIGMMHQIKLWMKSIGEPYIDKDNALIHSAKYGKLDFVECLLTTGADVHTRDDYPLQWASNNEHLEVVKVLLAAGADVHADNDAALRWASNNGHTEVVKVIKDHITKEKKVTENVNEKFTQDSDPIHDMGIGLYINRNFDSYTDMAKFILEFLPDILELKKIPKDIIFNNNNYYITQKYHEQLDNYLYNYISIREIPIKKDSMNTKTGPLHNELCNLLKQKGYKTFKSSW